MNWYYADAGQQVGPISEADLEALAQSGKIQPSTLVWRDGLKDWIPYAQIKAGANPEPAGLPPAASAGDEIVCAECNKIFSKNNAIQYGGVWVCANCKPIFVQKLREGATLPGQGGALNYAGFWIRFGAKFVDGLIFLVILAIPIGFVIFGGIKSAAQGGQPGFGQLALQFGIQLAAIAVAVGYNTFFIGKYAATPGKMACGLKVVLSDGGPVSYLRAFGRAWAEQLSGMICYIGYIIAGFDKEKRALHDHICNTRVIRK